MNMAEVSDQHTSQDLEAPSAAPTLSAKVSTGSEGVMEAAKPRRTRKPKAVEPVAETDDAPAPKPRRTRRVKSADTAPAGDDAAEQKPRRQRRRKVEAPAEDAAQTVASAEVLQARALAQVSQASVARKQRRDAERAARAVSEPKPMGLLDSPASTIEPLQESKAVPSTGPAPVVEPAVEQTPEKTKGEDVASDVSAPAESVEADLPPKPRARKRTRKAKAENHEVADTAAAPASEAEQDSVESDKSADNRPGRGVRAAKAGRRKNAKDSVAEQPVQQDVVDSSDKDASASDTSDSTPAPAEEKGERRARRTHQDRHGARNERSRQQGQRNKRNARMAPAEPTLSREELTAMKVAELRVKAKEFDLDTSGKKKAELVEEIYTTAARLEGFRDIEGILDIAHEGFGYIRAQGYMPTRDDAFVPANMIRGCGLRPGDIIKGSLRPSRANDKYPALAKIESVNGVDPEQAKRRPKFADLTPIYPNEQLKMEHGKDSITGRAIDIVSPIGKGQRGLIVSPPKAGKTTILKKICQAISANNPEVHLICLLVDERPEEVTDMQRSIKGDVVASTFDMPADNHTRVAELVIERAKRIVEMGGDVVVVLDSITRLARAYNLAAPASGRILSGGVDSAALYPPKRFLGAARNIENGGSLTILASALIDTGSKMDEVIFEEFKGTGNMELKLDRDLADRRIFPAIDPVASGTRNEDLLVDETMRPFVWGLRRILANMNNTERAAASFIKGLKNTGSNQEFLIRTAKKAADHEMTV